LKILLGGLWPLAEAKSAMLEKYPAGFRTEVGAFLLLTGDVVEGPFAGEWERWLKTGIPTISPLVKFIPRGEPRPVDKEARCGPAVFLVDRALFSRVFPTRCPLISSLFSRYAPLSKRRAGRGYYIKPALICPVVEALAEVLGVSDPWEAAALYKQEGGRRRHLQGFAALLYWCRTGRTPEGDYLLGRLSGAVWENNYVGWENKIFSHSAGIFSHT
jgi:hypothetical protein